MYDNRITKKLTGALSAAANRGVGNSGSHSSSIYRPMNYWAKPVALIKSEHSSLPENLTPGVNI